MPRRVIRNLVAAATVVLAAPGHVAAGEGTGTTTTTAAQVSPGEIAATAGLDLTGGTTPASKAAAAPRCSYFPYDMATSAMPGPSTGPVRRDALTKELTVGGPAGPNTETLYTRTCPGHIPDYVWMADVVDVDALISSAFQSVSAQLPTPTLDINPRPDVGGIVNIGLWLAVADPGRVTITAAVGPVWATVTAEYRGTTWTFGNGDSTFCEGLGTPIIDTNTEDQGPCGYTYRWPSAPSSLAPTTLPTTTPPSAIGTSVTPPRRGATARSTRSTAAPNISTKSEKFRQCASRPAPPHNRTAATTRRNRLEKPLSLGIRITAASLGGRRPVRPVAGLPSQVLGDDRLGDAPRAGEA